MLIARRDGRCEEDDIEKSLARDAGSCLFFKSSREGRHRSSGPAHHHVSAALSVRMSCRKEPPLRERAGIESVAMHEICSSPLNAIFQLLSGIW